MAAFGNVTIYDALATPVLHTLSPMSNNGETCIWRESAASSVLAAIVLQMSRIKVKSNSGLERFRLKLIVPALEVVTGSNSSGYTAAPRLAYTLQAVTDYTIPSRASTQQRTDIMKYVRQVNTETTAQFGDAVILGLMPS